MDEWFVSSVDLGGTVEVDEGSLQQSMDKNKEALQKKLLLRRPINQLVEQGIMPPLNTPPAFHEQRQKLERAKTGDFLRSKIQKRPERQELVQQHILEDTKVDGSLQEKQRQLRKAHLADDLNDRLSHRPGPLELIKGNILQADEKFTQAVKEGQIPFKNTCEGEICKHPAASFKIEEDSSSEGAISPQQDIGDQSQNSFTPLKTSQSSRLAIVESKDSKSDPQLTSSHSSAVSPTWSQAFSLIISQNQSPTHTIFSVADQKFSPPVNQIRSPSQTSFPSPWQQEEGRTQESNSSSSKTRRKFKSKSHSKTKTIKFHEYKGPPSAQKSTSPTATSENSYELLLQQQQLFLQWQLEWQQKYPQIILSSSQNLSEDRGQFLSTSHMYTSGQNIHTHNQDINSTSQQPLNKLEDMKVSDLKIELKKRNLPVSGAKPHLIERLKPYLDGSNRITSSASTEVSTTRSNSVPCLPVGIEGIILDTLPSIPQQTVDDSQQSSVSSVVAMDMSSSVSVLSNSETLCTTPTGVEQAMEPRPASVVPMDIDDNSIPDGTNQLANVDIVRMQQRKIQELYLELQRSKLQLQRQQTMMQHQQQAILPAVTAAVTIPITSQTVPSIAVPGNSQNLELNQCHLHHEQIASSCSNIPSTNSLVQTNFGKFLQPHLPVVTVDSTLTSSPMATTTESISSFPGITPIIFCQTNDMRPTISSVNKHRVNSIPNGIGYQRTTSLPNFNTMLNIIQKSPSKMRTEPQFFMTVPDHNEATKKQFYMETSNQQRLNPVKSQAVDDVLEILIKSGELSPSAAHEPVTPNSPEIHNSECVPVFPSATHLVLNPPPSMALCCETGLDNQSTLDMDFQLHNYHVSGNRQSVDLHDRGMYPDWFSATQPHVSASRSYRDSQPYYSISNDHDPLLSNFGTSHGPLDLFSLEEMGKKPPAVTQEFST
ncbi:uncharacterized protein LOC143233783 isoform X2 [Tachypleus tridentatus]|uniref:uncharacterized protein LOC143233783 isoform X2 n=1 Tax=Tachypleus tridentatus TaxID=6853 RepID=UPI003FD6AFC8